MVSYSVAKPGTYISAPGSYQATQGLIQDLRRGTTLNFDVLKIALHDFKCPICRDIEADVMARTIGCGRGDVPPSTQSAKQSPTSILISLHSHTVTELIIPKQELHHTKFSSVMAIKDPISYSKPCPPPFPHKYYS